MKESSPSCQFRLETNDGHSYIVNFDHPSNALAAETIKNLKSEHSGNIASCSTTYDLGQLYAGGKINQPQTTGSVAANALTSAQLMAMMVFLIRKTGRSITECKDALVASKFSLEDALRLLSKK